MIGGITVKTLQMGLATNTDIAAGIMGIGYDTNEAIFQIGNTGYPNLVDMMVAQKLINSKAYSLWLNDLGKHQTVLRHGKIGKINRAGFRL